VKAPHAPLFTARSRWLIGLCAAAVSFPAPAQPADAAEAKLQAAVRAVNKAALAGPASIKLLDQAVLKLPRDLAYIPAKEAARLAAAMGNRTGEGLLGMAVSLATGSNEFIVMRFARSGYIKDDDAKDWQADELLSDLKKGAEEANKERRSRGVPEAEVVGWIEAPKYDAAAHRLVWLLESKDKGARDDVWGNVRYNVYALGRDGYISMHFVTREEQLQAGKAIVQTLLAALQYNDGKRYGDFNPATDPVAEHGLAALVSGVAAQKPGLFAPLFAFLLKFAKHIGVAILGIAAITQTIYKIRIEAAADATPPSS
jgi:uncharacterized membrane-anchored protein